MKNKAFVFVCHCLTLCLYLSSASAQVDWRTQMISLPAPSVILFGEQHDAPEHQELVRINVERLISANQLSALALEMVEEGLSTEGIDAHSDETTVRNTLKWNEAGWPWQRYGPLVMQAVRTGVPVVGANLPRAEMHAVMQDETWDQKVPQAILVHTQDSMVTDHCGLLPASQAPAMARIQIARNDRMALTVNRLRQKDKTVFLLAGSEHVKKDRGIPIMMTTEASAHVQVVWMQATMNEIKEPLLADVVWQTPPIPFKDYCAELARSIK